MKIKNLLDTYDDRKYYIYLRKKCKGFNFKQRMSKVLTNNIIEINKFLKNETELSKCIDNLNNITIYDKSIIKNHYVSLYNKLNIEDTLGYYLEEDKNIRLFMANGEYDSMKYVFVYLHEFGHHVDHELNIRTKLLDKYNFIKACKPIEEIIANLVAMYVLSNFISNTINEKLKHEIVSRLNSDFLKLDLTKEQSDNIIDTVMDILS